MNLEIIKIIMSKKNTIYHLSGAQTGKQWKQKLKKIIK